MNTAPGLLTGLPPLIAPNCRLLILGSFPGVSSLAASQYYGHPRNHFWPLMGMILASSAQPVSGISYENRSKWLLQHGIGLWDVYAACERVGSLDADIRHPRLNDLAGLRQQCPLLQAVAHNGGESYKHRRHTEALGLPVYKLPSSSPANASWSFERKLAAWRAVIQPQQGA